MFDLRKACLWTFPKVSYTNLRKEFPMAGDCFKAWFTFNRAWSGRIWNFCHRHHQISLDFRLSWIDDMVFPNTTKQDRKAVDEALEEN